MLFVTLTIFGQGRTTIQKNLDYRKQQKAAADKHIRGLQNGVILMRLDFRQRQIDHYKKWKDTANANREIAKLKAKQKKMNLRIIEGFRTHFDFCPVYFFAQHDSRKIREGDYSDVIFYDNNCEPDPSIRITKRPVYIATFAKLEADTVYYQSDWTPNTGNPDSPVRTSNYQNSRNGRHALILRDDKFQQLNDPLPFFVSCAEPGPMRRSYKGPIALLNTRLKQFATKSGI